MDVVFIENEFLKASFKPLGAELCSLVEKETGTEHVWQANKEVWGRHAPILFPIVGQVENNQYHIGSKIYSLSQHGFARDFPFEITEHVPDKVVFLLKSNEASLKLYPYRFELEIRYSLKTSLLKIEYEVKNIDNQVIYFSIGAHPGFVCPFMADEKFDDYTLRFERKESAQRLLFEKGLRTGEKVGYLHGEDTIPISHSLFAKDAIILENLSSKWVDLKNRKGNKVLRFHFEGFPLLAFWTHTEKNAPYLCIEPWFGVADVRGANKDYREKDFIEKLDLDEKFSCTYGVELLEE